MKVLVIGSGGREHAVVHSLKKSPRVDSIVAIPGNGGIALDRTCGKESVCVPIGAKDIDAIVDYVSANPVDFAVITPDDPLVLGLADRLRAIGIPCFGPSMAAARIEGSKIFSKNLMKKYGIPTAEYETFYNKESALDYLTRAKYPTVVKADGLALGKGVLICANEAEAREAVHEMMDNKIFGDSGSRIIIEEFLEGPEVSVLSFTDGKVVVPMISSMDHKRALDGDEGLNTGGMGTIAPNPFYTEAVAKECMEKIFLPTINAMKEEGCPFSGCLYFGLMITKDGPKVIEYNCRFGDPETQVVLPLLESDLFEIMLAVEEGRLADTEVKFSDGAACCVVVASGGYPGKYATGARITIGELENSVVFCAGVKQDGDAMLTSGGRVLGVVACDKTLEGAIARAYADTPKVTFNGAFYRRDIGRRALSAIKK